MTIKLTIDEFYEQSQDTDEEQMQLDPSDEFDITCKFDNRISQGWWRDIELRNGLWLTIDRHQPADRLVIASPETEGDFIHCAFLLSGKGQDVVDSRSTTSGVPMTTGKYYLEGSGVQLEGMGDYSDVEPCSFLEVSIQPAMLRSFVGSSAGELPETLQHLVKSCNELRYIRYGDSQLRMTSLLQEILRCPYQGIIKRMYLESKVIELMALVLENEIEIQQGKSKKGSLKPDQLERIYYAKEILLRDLSNPPSLAELAQQVGLNDCTLRQGFHQVFNTTVFDQLHLHRLEVAKQLLSQQELSVTEVAHQIGYASLPSFIKAFKRKFGITPKVYQKACR